MQSPFDVKFLLACGVVLIALCAKADLAEQDTRDLQATADSVIDAQVAAVVAMRGE